MNSRRVNPVRKISRPPKFPGTEDPGTPDGFGAGIGILFVGFIIFLLIIKYFGSC